MPQGVGHPLSQVVSCLGRLRGPIGQYVRYDLGDRRTGRSALPFDWGRRARSDAPYHIAKGI